MDTFQDNNRQDNDSLYSWSSGDSSHLGSNSDSEIASTDSPLTKLGQPNLLCFSESLII